MKLMSSIFFRSSFMGCILPAHDKLAKNKEKTYADVPKYNTGRLRVKIAMRKS